MIRAIHGEHIGPWGKDVTSVNSQRDASSSTQSSLDPSLSHAENVLLERERESARERERETEKSLKKR